MEDKYATPSEAPSCKQGVIDRRRADRKRSATRKRPTTIAGPDWQGSGTARKKENIPVLRGVNHVQVLAALLAKILDVVRVRLFCGEAYAGTVLPRVADLALHKIASHVVGNLSEDALEISGVSETKLGVRVEGRGPGIVIVAADAADGLVVLLGFIAVRAHASEGFQAVECSLPDTGSGAMI